MQRSAVSLKNVKDFKHILPEQESLSNLTTQIITLEKDETLFNEGDLCNYFLLVLDGQLKIEKISANGGELVLYHVGPRQACELSTACLLAGQAHQTYAVAASTTTVALLAKKDFFHLFNFSQSFQQYVFSVVNRAADHLLEMIEEIVFVSLDQRLAKFLLQKHTHANPISTTHHEIASELGTAREVISRMLKVFEQKGWIHRERGKIWIKDCISMNFFIEGNKITEH